MFPYPYEPQDVSPLDPTAAGIVFAVFMAILCIVAAIALWAGFHERHHHDSRHR